GGKAGLRLAAHQFFSCPRRLCRSRGPPRARCWWWLATGGVCGDHGITRGRYRAGSPVGGREARMATKITVTLADDLDGGPAEETVRFGLDGTGYEIDLTKKNAGAFRRNLPPFIDHARRAGRAPRRRPGRTAASRQRSGDIRAWAKDQGLPVSTRGRIPESVVQRYQAATTRS